VPWFHCHALARSFDPYRSAVTIRRNWTTLGGVSSAWRLMLNRAERSTETHCINGGIVGPVDIVSRAF